jgi:competence protein ComGC
MKKIALIVLVIIVLITIVINIPNITAQAKWYSFKRHKKVETVTKVVTLHDMADLLHDQRTLAGELQDSSTYSLIGDEVRNGLDEASRHEVFLQQHDEIESIKVRLPVTFYKDKNKTIEFISGEGEVVEEYES